MVAGEPIPVATLLSSIVETSSVFVFSQRSPLGKELGKGVGLHVLLEHEPSLLAPESSRFPDAHGAHHFEELVVPGSNEVDHPL